MPFAVAMILMFLVPIVIGIYTYTDDEVKDKKNNKK